MTASDNDDAQLKALKAENEQLKAKLSNPSTSGTIGTVHGNVIFTHTSHGPALTSANANPDGLRKFVRQINENAKLWTQDVPADKHDDFRRIFMELNQEVNKEKSNPTRIKELLEALKAITYSGLGSWLNMSLTALLSGPPVV